MFWVDFSNSRIVRGNGIETPSSYTTLVKTGITCAGKCILLYWYVIIIILKCMLKSLSVFMGKCLCNHLIHVYRWTSLGLDCWKFILDRLL